MLLITWQDFKFRAISWIILPILAVLFTIKGILIQGYEGWLNIIILNFSLFLILVAGIILYSFLKFKSFKSPFDLLIGWGDILFMLVLALAMFYINYLVFIISSCVIILLIVLISMSFKKQKTPPTIPLAGAQALLFVFVMLFEIQHKQIFFHANILGL